MTSTASRTKTYEDFLKTPGDGLRYELFDGEIVVSPSASQRHEWISQLLNQLLFGFVVSRGLGRVYTAALDVRLDRDVVVQPDLFFIRAGSPADNPETTWIEGSPALVIEILSKSTANLDLHRKRELYEKYGIEEYWIVDPVKQTILALALVNGAYEPIPQTGGRFESRAIPGLKVRVATVF